MKRPRWMQWRHQPEPSPIPEAAKETRLIAAEVARVVEQLRRFNDAREAKQ